MSRLDNRSFTSTSSSVASSASEATALELEQLRGRLENFYRVVDPIKLQDETKVNELLRWARKYSIPALLSLIKRKYGLEIEQVDSSEKGWLELKDALFSFYKKHDRFKPSSEIEKIYVWTKQNGVARLNIRLVAKYGVPIQSIQLKRSDGLSAFKARYKHAILAQKLSEMNSEVTKFFNEFHKQGTQAEIERLVQYGISEGRDALNQRLDKEFGNTLDNLTKLKGNTEGEKAAYLEERIRNFYATYATDEVALNEEKVNALTEWGLGDFDGLNEHLLRTFGFDLDSKPLSGEEIRQILFHYFTSLREVNPNAPKKAASKHELEELINLARRSGLKSLSQHLLHEYGVELPQTNGIDKPRRSSSIGSLTRMRRSLSKIFQAH
mmetsp:Transcript_6133/g.10895  ORF Transcript_6133/g.10895 Transcript_6133/m.10895 type:complete len:382 (+) Transcript_6133:227-1372(+)